MKRCIFVFGSNLAGRHGKGAALYAKKYHGAIYGQGIGPQGESYAIPTKDEKLNTLPISQIKQHVDDFLRYAEEHQEQIFSITAIGCGLAGYKPSDIAPLFVNVPPNCILPDEFKLELGLLRNGKAETKTDRRAQLL